MIMPDQAAWMVLKSRGQTVGVKPYKAGTILSQYNWKNLYKNTNNASQKQVMRYILTMIALNPPYKNRKTGDRNKLTNNTIANMNNANFNKYLNQVRPVANQGTGIRKAFVRTIASGTRMATNKIKPYALPVAGAAVVAAMSGGVGAVAPAVMMRVKGLVSNRTRAFLTNKLKGIPYSNKIVNHAMKLAGSKFKMSGGANMNDNKIRQIIESSVENAVKNDPMINRKVNTAVETFVRQQRNIGNINYGEVAKYKAFIRQAILNGTFNASKAANNYQKKKLAGQLTGLAIAGGGLAAEGALGAFATKKAAATVVKGATGNGQRMAAEAAQRIAAKKAASAAKVPNMAVEAVKKSRVAFNLNKAKFNFIKKQLNRAARGESIPANVISKAINRAGGDPRIGHALEKGGQVARNLLNSL